MKLALVVLDESGSMAADAKGTISAHNDFLDCLAGVVDLVGVMLFNSARITVPDYLPPADQARLDAETYRPSAVTPLFDAVGHAIRHTQEAVSDIELATGAIPAVMICVLTDGAENASTDYTLETITAYIAEMERTRGWTFAYLGVGVDAWAAENTTMVMASHSMSANNTASSTTAQAYGSTQRLTRAWAADQDLSKGTGSPLV